MTAEPAERVSAQTLANQLERFVSCHRHGHDVDMRWLAVQCHNLRLVIGELVSSRGAGDDLRAKIRAHRAAEIEEELKSKRRELDNLERELAKTKAA